MQKVAFKMQLNKGQALAYKRRHDEIWPELVKLLKDTGIEDYSIFLDEVNNSLFGVLKIANLEMLDELPKHDIMQRWWQYMADIMQTNDDNSPVSFPLKEVFFLP